MKPNPSIAWMVEDALFLHGDGRKHSAILILLCAVDALAKRMLPDVEKNRERFEEFLKSRMHRKERPQVHDIFVPMQDRLLATESILYQFLRCPMIHEGTQLSYCRLSDEYNVYIDWDEVPNGIKVCRDRHAVLLGGEYILNVLLDAVCDTAAE